MNCPNCGTSLPDTARFCPNCGTRMEGVPQPPFASSQMSTPAGDLAPDDMSSSQALTPEKRRNTSLGIIVVVALALLLVAGGIVGIAAFLRAPDRGQEVSAFPVSMGTGQHEVTFLVDIAGYGDGSSRIPVRITGTESDGTAVDETIYLAYSGADTMLANGHYHAEVVGSPITPEGVIFEIPSLTIDFTLGDDLADGEPYVMPQDLALQFVPIDAADMTDDEIADAVAWARKDSDSQANVDALEQAAKKRRDTAVAPQEDGGQEGQDEGDAAGEDAEGDAAGEDGR